MDFYALYTSVGLWNAVYVIMYAITNATKLMKYSTRSTEEIFALFICIAFTVDAFKDAYSDFSKNYLNETCHQFDYLVTRNISLNISNSGLFSRAMVNSLQKFSGQCKKALDAEKLQRKCMITRRKVLKVAKGRAKVESL